MYNLKRIHQLRDSYSLYLIFPFLIDISIYYIMIYISQMFLFLLGAIFPLYYNVP